MSFNSKRKEQNELTQWQVFHATGFDTTAHGGTLVQGSIPEGTLLLSIVLEILEVVPLDQVHQPGVDLLVVEVVDCVYGATAVVNLTLELAETLLPLVAMLLKLFFSSSLSYRER